MRKLIYLFGIAMMVSGCATGGPISSRKNVQPLVYDASKSYVYFYRPCMIWGVARGITVYDDKNNIGGINCSTYFIYETNPGVHKFHAGDRIRQEKVLEMVLQPGSKYFIKTDLRIGIIDTVPSLTLMDNIGEDKLKPFRQISGN